jgi:hypothetical protein
MVENFLELSGGFFLRAANSRMRGTKLVFGDIFRGHGAIGFERVP